MATVSRGIRPGSAKRRGEVHRRLAGQGATRAAWSKRSKWQAWRSRVFIDGRNIHLGYFATKEAALDARDEAVRGWLGDGYLKLEDRPA
jgi:hypothetical protein